eukprot:scaffold1019_cov338-Pavlova_lutheri.AAC.4
MKFGVEDSRRRSLLLDTPKGGHTEFLKGGHGSRSSTSRKRRKKACRLAFPEDGDGGAGASTGREVLQEGKGEAREG